MVIITVMVAAVMGILAPNGQSARAARSVPLRWQSVRDGSVPEVAGLRSAQGSGKQAPGGSSGKPWIVYNPAAYHRAAKSKAWVYTPEGLMYKACTLRAPAHSTIAGDEIILRSGARQQIKPCKYPTLAYPGAGKPAQPLSVIPAPGPCYFGRGGDWWGATCWGSASPLTYLSEEYAVPTNPAKSGALMFFWGGLQDANGDTVLQDVLTWGANGAVTNPNIWYVTPWYVFNGRSAQGNSIHVAPGDTIYNSLTASNCNSSGDCSWELATTDLNNDRTGLLPITSGVSFNTLLGAVMEVPTANGCVETPANGHAAFRDLAASDINSTTVTPQFGISTPDPQCSVSVRASATGADILWTP